MTIFRSSRADTSATIDLKRDDYPNGQNVNGREYDVAVLIFLLALVPPLLRQQTRLRRIFLASWIRGCRGKGGDDELMKDAAAAVHVIIFADDIMANWIKGVTQVSY